VTYRIEWTAAAAKQLAKLDRPVNHRIGQAVKALADESHPAASTNIVGQPGLFRLRVGAYRVIYLIEERIVTITVVRVGKRDESTYQNL